MCVQDLKADSHDHLHLRSDDWIVMGVLLIAVGVATPTLARRARVLLLIGAVGNPLPFLPLAFGGSRLQQTWPSNAAAARSSAALPVALAWAAW
jgi:hypothetical protein